jgi:putative phage-type endonuclease
MMSMNMEQRSEEWFDTRKGRITGSAVGAILGVDPNRTRDDVMRDMVRQYCGLPREFQGNIATQYGVTHEEEALLDYESHTGVQVTRASFCVHSNFQWLGASPDGFVDDDTVLEIKCPFGLRDKQEPVFKDIADQPHYYAQVQVQMYVTDRTACHFWQWNRFTHRLELVSYDSGYISKIFPELRAFYEEFLRAIKDPDEHLEEKRKVIDTPRALQMIAEYDDLTQAIEQAEGRKKELLAEIVKAAGDKNAVFGGRKLTKIEKQGSISYAQAIKVLVPGANLEPWRGKPSSYWLLK